MATSRSPNRRHARDEQAADGPQRWQDGGARPGRKVAAKMMHAVLSAPVIIAGPSRRFTVVDGGKPDEPPVHSADSGESTE
jgi:hypothetical protein